MLLPLGSIGPTGFKTIHTAETVLFVIWTAMRENLSLPGFSDKVRFKPACPATETNYKIEITLIASLDMILSN